MEDNLFFYDFEFIRVILFSLSWLLITMGIVNEVCFLMIITCTVFLHPVSIERKHLVSQSLHLLNQAPHLTLVSWVTYYLYILFIISNSYMHDKTFNLRDPVKRPSYRR